MSNNIQFNIELVIDEYSNYIFKIVDNVVGTSLPYQDKEEIVSDVFYLLWKNQNNIQSNLKSYIGTIARNCSYEKLRKNKITFEYTEVQDISNLVEYDNILIIKEKLNKLTAEEKNIFYLYYVDGLKIKDISKKLNKNISAIKIKLFRIRKKLKEDN
ncbi:MAG: sigma-70 family RNA polymerase sigma factor [Bacilli bacterium]|nr:sigma-70 family RNA polymerase sigma factor [Bacilli bacterium]MBQ7139879.1 sigma-70 family RNA polymerase sigma factor [Bacilli bacterium]